MVNHSKTFYLNNGKTFSSLKGLAKELAKMSEDVYNHHVSPHKNDFANWVRDALREKELAEKVDRHLLRIELELETLRHIVHGSTGAKPKKAAPKKKKAPAKKKPAVKKKISHKKK